MWIKWGGVQKVMVVKSVDKCWGWIPQRGRSCAAVPLSSWDSSMGHEEHPYLVTRGRKKGWQDRGPQEGEEWPPDKCEHISSQWAEPVAWVRKMKEQRGILEGVPKDGLCWILCTQRHSNSVLNRNLQEIGHGPMLRGGRRKGEIDGRNKDPRELVEAVRDIILPPHPGSWLCNSPRKGS